MTKVTTLQELMGGKPKKSKHRQIELLKLVNQEDGSVTVAGHSPSNFKNLILVSKATEIEEYDVIAACGGSDDSTPIIFLGHWNDGFVEQ